MNSTIEVEHDELVRLLEKATKVKPTPEELREYRISYIMSCIGRFDDETRKAAEQAVDSHYGILTP